MVDSLVACFICYSKGSNKNSRHMEKPHLSFNICLNLIDVASLIPDWVWPYDRLLAARKRPCPSSQIQMETSIAGQRHTCTATSNTQMSTWHTDVLLELGGPRAFSRFASCSSQSNLVLPKPQTCTCTWQLTPVSQLDNIRITNVPQPQ